MPSISRILCFFALALCLAACGNGDGDGEGWEMQFTQEVFPYGNQRTAGSGVVYVRAKMMKEKQLNLVPVSRDLSKDVRKKLETDLKESLKK